MTIKEFFDVLSPPDVLSIESVRRENPTVKEISVLFRAEKDPVTQEISLPEQFWDVEVQKIEVVALNNNKSKVVIEV